MKDRTCSLRQKIGVSFTKAKWLRDTPILLQVGHADHGTDTRASATECLGIKYCTHITIIFLLVGCEGAIYILSLSNLSVINWLI